PLRYTRPAMNTLRLVLLGTVGCAILGSVALPAAQPAAHAEVATTIARHGLQEGAEPLRAHPAWRTPRKIVLLQFGQRWGRPDELSRAVGSTNLIIARSAAEAAAAVADADGIMGYNPEICDPRIINNARQLRWLASLSAGVENCMELPAVKARSLVMTNMRGIDSPVIAEHAIALMLALAHGLDRFAIDTSRAVWSRDSAARVPMQSLEGKTLLVSGLGGIGTEVARRAHGLGMRVVATRVGGSGKPDFVEHVGQPDELLALARSADVIVSAVPLTRETTNLYDARFFAAVKPTAFFINIARGGSVVTEALMAALNEGRLAGAGLDVVEPEPLPPDHPLWKSPRILFTPHISARSDLPGEARWIIAADNLRRYVAGERLLNVVDLQRGF
ncbi:MAG TPA: D-2-hydroxyacid dehydrogenase, partial [Steroidobacteraceae bacterium]|nr:D-2-hydroxyacid dehydrogenase [Steroidobacteraceae bacterium]